MEYRAGNHDTHKIGQIAIIFMTQARGSEQDLWRFRLASCTARYPRGSTLNCKTHKAKSPGLATEANDRGCITLGTLNYGNRLVLFISHSSVGDSYPMTSVSLKIMRTEARPQLPSSTSLYTSSPKIPLF